DFLPPLVRNAFRSTSLSRSVLFLGRGIRCVTFVVQFSCSAVFRFQCFVRNTSAQHRQFWKTNTTLANWIASWNHPYNMVRSG
ncbi:hypothetical protein LSTR_LSTR015552, partial [Laodelphax striatellus]